MTCPELRITEAEAADCPRRDVVCSHCKGRGMCSHWFDGEPEPSWCCDCDGSPVWSTPSLPTGASARIGAIVVERLPHLRHAVWPPKKAPRIGVAGVMALVAAVAP